MESENIYAAVLSLPCSQPTSALPATPPRPSSGISTASMDDDCSPPLPPKPHTMTATQEQQPEEEDLYMAVRPVLEEKGPFSLSEFVSKYGQFLPLCISVERGYESDNERDSIAMGDIYNIHFVKRSKVVVLKDSTDTTYNIPLNSPVQFAPVFHHSEQEDETSEKIFDKVSNVIACKPLPTLLRATKSHTKDDKVLVEKNEILVVQKVITSTLRKKTLQVYSVSHKKEKILPGDCAGGFTSDPYATRLHLPDIISLFDDKFPLKVRMYLTDIEFTDGCDFPPHLESEVSELTAVRTETSLVASTYWGEDQAKVDDQCLIDIPIGLEVEVRVHQPDKREEVREQDLFQRTKTFYETFHTAKIRTIRVSSCDLSMGVRKGYEREGVLLEEPNRVYDFVQRQTQTQTRQSPATTRRPIPPAVVPRHAHLVHAPIKERPELPGQVSVGSGQRVGGKEHTYQPLTIPPDNNISQEAMYVTMAPAKLNSPSKTGAKSQHAMTDTEAPTASTGGTELTVEGHPPVIMQLISRIEQLEEQVALLKDKVEKLTR